MCGIFGYKWEWDAIAILLQWLQRLEYRGYDSAGLFVMNSNNDMLKSRAVGKVAELASKLQDNKDHSYNKWIAHTRWATHGWVTQSNTHPHQSNDGKRSIVHNGIVENYASIKKDLIKEWFEFHSETDTEVVANLLQKHYDGDMLTTVQKIQKIVRWAYALLVMHTDHPDEMIAMRLWSPLLYAYNEDGEHFFSSDAQALSGYADKMIYLEDGDIIYLTWAKYQILANGEVCKRDVETFDQELLQASKWDFKHFMLKEIFEQPNTVKRTMKGRINFENMSLHGETFHGMGSEDFKKIVTVACGTMGHVWWLWTYRLQNVAKIPAYHEIASEYENKPFFVDPSVLHIFLSQSWETADTLETLKMVKEQWGKTLGIVNVVWSSIARETDDGLYVRAGTEISVASTKAFITPAVLMLLVSLFLGKRRGMRLTKYQQIMRELEHLPAYIETVLDQSDHIRSVAMDLIAYKNFFFLGRWYQYPIAAENSLKFKETTYLHSEAYAAGELKHGSLALIDKDFPTIFNLPHDEMFEQNLSNMQEVRAREGKVCVIWDRRVEDADWQITIPETIDEIYPFLTAVAGQLLAYHMADLLGNDIDKPRNLAKSVTVK